MRTERLIFGAAVAASFSAFGATAWAADAPAIVQPANGATVSSPVTVIVSPGTAGGESGAMSGMDKGMAQNVGMSAMPHGHLHLLVDSPLPKSGSKIPMDAHHIHLMHGETKVTLQLPPGPHTLQLLKGTSGHSVPEKPQTSGLVTFTVK
jgi:hypothetical protein